jgi:crotonobetaine/carnitine-CoA ligase
VTGLPANPPGSDDGFIRRFVHLAATEPSRVFARFDGEALTFAALYANAARIAGLLRDRGVQPGDRVAVMLENSPDAVALLLALAMSGAVWVPLNVQLRADGLRYIVDDAEPRALIAREDFVLRVRGCGARLDGVAVIADTAVAAAARGGDGASPAALPAPEDLFAIGYTSGTTGAPKGVQMTHRMMRLAGEGALLVSAARDGDVFHMWEPLYHIGGSQMIIVPMLRDVVLHMVPRFSASRFWGDVRAAGATHIHFLGGILQILLTQPPSPLDRQHRVRVAWGGGCPPDVWRAVQDRFGVQVRECYGMTEASSFSTYNDSGLVGSVGRPVPWFDVAVLDAQCRTLPPQARGEIVVRGRDPRALTPGYFRNREATARVLRDGALHTGDLGSRDPAGNFFFHGRMTDSVRVRGENVSAWEVEHVAAQHPAVEDCAMIGVAAEIGEQDIKLFVSPKPGCTVDPAELSRWLGERLAPYQNPRYLAVVDAFERTPSQRIMKHRLPPGRDGCFDRVAAGPPAG